MNMRVAIVGCGLIGRKRAGKLPSGSLAIACDLDPERARSLASGFAGCEPCFDPAAAVQSDRVSAVIIATLNNSLYSIAKMAISQGKHVLVEKPAATRLHELVELQALAEAMGVQVRVGYNHRYHPACIRAGEIVESGVLGPLMFVRARYGHGGRVGYDREWRADPALSGGGELLDQGVHLIDLAGLFLGPFTVVEGHVGTFYWDMPVDDNAFMSLRTASGQTAWLHASCSEWKNLFSLEIYGRNGKLHWEGLGGSYGIERLTHYQMLEQMGPPDTVIHEFPRGDDSWRVEMEHFAEDIRLGRTPVPGLKEAAAVLRVVEELYRPGGRESTE